METYTYTGRYFDIETQEPLLEEGILKGEYGTLHVKRCTDGYAIYDSCFLGSGFVCTPTAANLGYPNSINGIPVTEIHCPVKLKPNCFRHPIVIEGANIKRAYLSVGRKTAQDEMREGDGLENALRALFSAIDESYGKSEVIRISIGFCNGGKGVDLCEIRCNEKCILEGIEAKRLEIIAPSAVLSGKAYGFLEHMKVSGRIYPYRYSDWDHDVQDTDYFEGIESLKSVEGSLCGDLCWTFRGCKSLERVHLANGMQKVPPYAFFNCSSLTDLYIPDTVTEIGEYAFSGCTKLSSVHLPSGIKKISKGLFKNCCSLGKCYLSDDIEEIEGEAFVGCTVLRKPWIPKGIKKIAETAFDDPAWAKPFD